DRVTNSIRMKPFYTRRRFGGRHPLCGTGVVSLIAVISKPAACNDRIAASRPAPGPFTVTSNVCIPLSTATLAAASEAICAAKGVDLREPLKPRAPALLQAMVFPCSSVIVTIVLLKVECICAIPELTLWRTRRLLFVFLFVLAILYNPPYIFISLFLDRLFVVVLFFYVCFFLF